MPPRTPYTHDTLSLAVQAVLSEEHTVPSAASAYDIPQRTLRKHVSKAKSGVNTNDVTMGPSPLLPHMFEDDLATWVLVMARDGHPVGCREIKQKATQMLQRVHGIQHLPSLSTGWYSRFLGRHPDLKILKAQVLTKSRNPVDSTTIVEFVHQLAHSASLVNMDPIRIFNMDKPASLLRRNPRKCSSTNQQHLSMPRSPLLQHMLPLWRVLEQMEGSYHRCLSCLANVSQLQPATVSQFLALL
ncbi:hypothetical protein DYB28_004729 [Aphanomyces astaci]|uniref:HTH CENPB-type domain-containing protein n=1 Tax=Aphanomyces astaci TaxID=112090 RepID=A0A9X8DK68_APHAT|nr:hypothetical protein DYB28_004729 [Aphanomyces astaci]